MKRLLLVGASAFVIMSLHGCAVKKQLVPTGGSRADGIIRLAFEYDMFEKPQVNPQQGMNAAQQRCAAWGYSGAEPFGGARQTCIAGSRNGCERWLVTVDYQCTGAPSAPK